MALRSVLEIDVNDDKFKAFRESFEKYRTAVDKLPSAWKAVGAGAQSTSNIFRDIAALTLAQQERIAMSVQHTQTLNRHLGVTHRTMGAIERTTHAFGQHIADITKHIFSWRTALGLAGFAALDLFGISRLAQSASGGFRTATGLGTTWGGMGGFNVGFGQLLQSPQSMLGNIQQGKIDPTSDQRRALATLGFTPTQIAQMDPATLASEAAVRMGAWARRQRPESLGTMSQVSGMTSLAPIGDIINLRDRPDEAMAAREKARQLAEENHLTKDQLKVWAQLNQTLSAAKFRIETALIDTLGHLEPGLNKLINAFSRAVSAFIKSPVVAEWLDKLSEGMKVLADWISGPNFKTDTEAFAKWIGEASRSVIEFARNVGHAIEWINNLLKPSSDDWMQPHPGTIPKEWRRHGDKLGFGPARRATPIDDLRNWLHSLWASGASGGDTPRSFEERARASVGFFEGKGLTHQQAIGITGRLAAESGGLSPTAENPTSHAIGLAQWLKTRKPLAEETGGNFWKQLDLVWGELTTTHKDALAKIQHSQSAYDAAISMEAYEIAQNPAFTEKAAKLADAIGRILDGGHRAPAAATSSAPAHRPHHRQAANPTVRVVIDNRTGASTATLANMATASV